VIKTLTPNANDNAGAPGLDNDHLAGKVSALDRDVSGSHAAVDVGHCGRRMLAPLRQSPPFCRRSGLGLQIVLLHSSRKVLNGPQFFLNKARRQLHIKCQSSKLQSQFSLFWAKKMNYFLDNRFDEHFYCFNGRFKSILPWQFFLKLSICMIGCWEDGQPRQRNSDKQQQCQVKLCLNQKFRFKAHRMFDVGLSC
jgi:hypothetical protein